MADLRDTIHIDAPASLVYDLISDLTRMGEWSPECERVSWRGGATTAEKGRHLAFDVFIGPAAISHWEYFIVPDDDGSGCTVAEEWTDRRGAASRAISERILGDRRSHNRSGIRQTLAALKRSAEGQHHR